MTSCLKDYWTDGSAIRTCRTLPASTADRWSVPASRSKSPPESSSCKLQTHGFVLPEQPIAASDEGWTDWCQSQSFELTFLPPGSASNLASYITGNTLHINGGMFVH